MCVLATNSERMKDADQGTEMKFLVDNNFLFYFVKKRDIM